MMAGMVMQQAGQASSQIQGAGLGLVVDHVNRKLDYKQAQKYNEMNIASQKEMGQYNQNLALDMWNKTNYGAQRKHMEKAGLNVGLMYGQGGGGGATTSTPVGNIQGQSAGQYNASGMGLASGQNLAMNQAQIDLLKAQKNNVDADTENKTGGQREKLYAEIENLKQVTENAKIQENIMVFDKQIREIEANIAQNTEKEIIDKIEAESSKLNSEALIAKNQGTISEETYNEIIKQSKMTSQKMALEMLMQKALIKQTGAQTELTKEQKEMTSKLTDKYRAEIQRMGVQTEQDWEKLSQGDRDLIIKKTLADFHTNNPAEIKQMTEILNDITKSYRDIIGYSK